MGVGEIKATPTNYEIVGPQGTLIRSYSKQQMETLYKQEGRRLAQSKMESIQALPEHLRQQAFKKKFPGQPVPVSELKDVKVEKTADIYLSPTAQETFKVEEKGRGFTFEAGERRAYVGPEGTLIAPSSATLRPEDMAMIRRRKIPKPREKAITFPKPWDIKEVAKEKPKEVILPPTPPPTIEARKPFPVTGMVTKVPRTVEQKIWEWGAEREKAGKLLVAPVVGVAVGAIYAGKGMYQFVRHPIKTTAGTIKTIAKPFKGEYIPEAVAFGKLMEAQPLMAMGAVAGAAAVYKAPSTVITKAIKPFTTKLVEPKLISAKKAEIITKGKVTRISPEMEFRVGKKIYKVKGKAVAWETPTGRKAVAIQEVTAPTGKTYPVKELIVGRGKVDFYKAAIRVSKKESVQMAGAQKTYWRPLTPEKAKVLTAESIIMRKFAKGFTIEYPVKKSIGKLKPRELALGIIKPGKITGRFGEIDVTYPTPPGVMVKEYVGLGLGGTKYLEKLRARYPKGTLYKERVTVKLSEPKKFTKAEMGGLAYEQKLRLFKPSVKQAQAIKLMPQQKLLGLRAVREIAGFERAMGVAKVVTGIAAVTTLRPITKHKTITKEISIAREKAITRAREKAITRAREKAITRAITRAREKAITKSFQLSMQTQAQALRQSQELKQAQALGLRQVTVGKRITVPLPIVPPTVITPPPIPTLFFPSSAPRKKKKAKPKTIPDLFPKYKPSYIAISERIFAKKVPETITGYGIRPIIRR